VKEKAAFDGDFARAEDLIKKSFSGRATAVDGIRIDMEEGWIHLRRSNTEPVVRIIAEARSLEEAENLAKEARKLL
jgi:phosphomannomutase